MYTYFTETAEFDSTTAVSAVHGGNIVLPTKLVFSSRGYCEIRPRFTAIEVALNKSNIFQCNISTGCVESPYTYDFEALDNFIVPSSVGEGEYVFAVRQCCPSSVLLTEYTVTFDSTSELILCLSLLFLPVMYIVCALFLHNLYLQMCICTCIESDGGL